MAVIETAVTMVDGVRAAAGPSPAQQLADLRRDGVQFEQALYGDSGDPAKLNAARRFAETVRRAERAARSAVAPARPRRPRVKRRVISAISSSSRAMSSSLIRPAT